ncbi:MAG: response regulator transcription factor [Moraxellaceae bacterium]
MTDTPVTSIRALREQYQQQAPAHRDLALLVSVAALVNAQPLEQCAEDILRVMASVLGTNHAVLLRYQSGRLTCIAGLGHAPPTKTRMPAQGYLPSLLKYPAAPLLRHPVDQAWVFMTAELQYELIVPMSYAGHITGLLAFAAPTATELPSNGVQLWLSTVATLLAGLWQDGTTRRRLSERAQHELRLLTPREREVMSFLPKGMSNRRIADLLGISAGTVKTHVEHILSKLQLDDRAHAAAKAVELKLGSTE